MRIVAVLLIALFTQPALAQDEPTPVRAAPALIESGLMQRLGALFRFRTRERIEAIESGEAAIAIEAAGEADAFFEARDGEARYRVTGQGAFVDWLRSEAGKRALAGYRTDGAPLYRLVVARPEPKVERAAVKDHPGEPLALRHCGRCHVIGPMNKFGGIGSTPSFPALRTIPHWEEKFAAFWTYNPHPAFTQVAEVTPPFPDHRPSPIAPMELTLEEVELIADYAATIPPADLGQPVVGR